MTKDYSMLSMLSDGRFHSGQALAEALGVSRTAVWKQLRKLAEFGLAVQSVPGRGYRLGSALELLCEAKITQSLDAETRRRLQSLEILPQTASTNDHLKGWLHAADAQGAVCLAEHQSQGRGRRGRAWQSPFGKNLYLSLLWRFPCGPAAMQGLSLAVGIALLRALEQAGLTGAGIKWPNDIQVQGEKLAGILIDMSGEASGPTSTVIGVGINIAMPEAAGEGIDQPWTDMQQHVQAKVSRNQLAAFVLNHIVAAAVQYEQRGLSAFLAQWQQYDLVQGRMVALQTPQGEVIGRAEGIDESGALRVHVNGLERRFSSGEISLRLDT